MASQLILQRMERIRQEIALLQDHLMPREARIGLDFIRSPEDLAIPMKFTLEVYYGGGRPGPSGRRSTRASTSDYRESPGRYQR